MGLIALNRYMKVAKRTIYIKFLPRKRAAWLYSVCTFTITSSGYIPHDVRKVSVYFVTRLLYYFLRADKGIKKCLRVIFFLSQ
ncbi:unnamed protein product [Pocillopora meandrina]|uniref:Uncharacterized protein n=1 Tax=Pocillopora meandrina TaxID=46732 RepID=A0AAU9X1Z1_9CNID|nr:unnamed protein product [Pocillopora meandrina]